MRFLTPFHTLKQDGSISHLAFSPHGILAVNGNQVILWDCSQKRPEPACAELAGQRPSSLAWSPDGSFFAVGHEQGVTLYDLAQTVRLTHAHNGDVDMLAWSPDGTMIASCSAFGECHLWDAKTGQTRAEWSFFPSPLLPRFCFWTPDGTIVFHTVIRRDEADWQDHLLWQVRAWDQTLTPSERLLAHGRQLSDECICAALSPTGATLAIGTRRGWVQLWQGQGPEAALIRHLPFHMDTITSLAWSPDEAYLASASRDGHVAIWDERGEVCFHTGLRQSVPIGVCWWQSLLAVADQVGQVALYRLPLQPLSIDLPRTPCTLLRYLLRRSHRPGVTP